MDTALASPAESETLIWIAFATGLVSLGLTVLLALQVTFMRASKRRRDRRHLRCLDTWRPILYQAAMGKTPEVPALAPTDEASVLLLSGGANLERQEFQAGQWRLHATFTLGCELRF